MADFETAITLSGADQKDIVLRFLLTERRGMKDEIVVDVTHGEENIGTVKWQVNYEAKTLTLNLNSLMSGPQAICLAACLGGSIGATLADCLAGAKTASTVRQCFREHAPGALVSSVSCVFGCLAV